MLMRSALFDFRREIYWSLMPVLFNITVFTYDIARHLTLEKDLYDFVLIIFSQGQQVTYSGLIVYLYAFKKNSLKKINKNA